MKICFVAPRIYPLLSGRSDIQMIGGAEVQQRYLGQGLRDAGHEIVYVTQDYGQPDGEVVDGMIVHKAFRPTAGVPGTRFFFPRVPKLWAALKKANADIYYIRGTDSFLGVVALFCKRYGRKLVFSGANDSDFVPQEVRGVHFYHKMLFHRGLRQVDAIICQSQQQQRLLAEHHRLSGVVLPNLFPNHALSPLSEFTAQARPIVWVSILRKTKRPQSALEVARDLPQYPFVMVGGRSLLAPELYDQIEKEARAIPNMRFLGFQPFETTEKIIGGAQVLINTSEWEGFPNTFLQAWRAGVPTISFHDPDQVIERNGLGVAVKSLDEMKAAIIQLCQEEQWRAYSQRVRQYFERNHQLENVIWRYEHVFQKLLENKETLPAPVGVN